MKTKILNYEIESLYTGKKVAPFSVGKYQNKNHHIIFVTNINTDMVTDFDYWESIKEKEIKTEDQLLQAFECFLQDAEASKMSIDDFQFEFGYEKASELIKVYNSCVESRKKAEKLEINYQDIVDEFEAIRF